MAAMNRDLGKLLDLGYEYVFIDEVTPVSYTHLDVYKRQSPANAAWTFEKLCAAWGDIIKV